jgi:hypothetical protein
MDTKLRELGLADRSDFSAAEAPGGWVLDVSALLAFADATAYAACVRALAARTGRTLLVPLPALAVAAARRAHPTYRTATAGGGLVGVEAARIRLTGLLAEPAVVAVDGSVAVGERFDRLVTRAGGDRLAAFVVLLGADRGWPVLTDRGDVLRRIRPDLLTIPS